MKNKEGSPFVDVEVNGVHGIQRGDIVSAMISVESIVPDPDNTNEMSDRRFFLLRQTMQEEGFIDPLSVIPQPDGKTFLINGGEHRWKAAKQIGLLEIPCEILVDDKWQDRDLQKFQLVRSNVLHGEQNPEKLMKLYTEAAEKFGKEKVASLMGFEGTAAVEKIAKQLVKDAKELLPKDMADKLEKEAGEAKSMADIKKIIEHMFETYGDTLQYGFMVFSFGGKEHVYLAASDTTNKSLKRLLELAKERGLKVERLLGEAIDDIIGGLTGPNGPDEIH